VKYRYSDVFGNYETLQERKHAHWRAINDIDYELDEIESMGFEDEDGEIIPLADYLARRD